MLSSDLARTAAEIDLFCLHLNSCYRSPLLPEPSYDVPCLEAIRLLERGGHRA